MTDLANRTCRPLPPGTPPMPADELHGHLASLPGWELVAEGKAIAKTYRFATFHETMSFANAVAHVVNVQDHHPDLAISYDKCRVSFNTHTVGGVSETVVFCAARVERLRR